jgi:hypothetical protein
MIIHYYYNYNKDTVIKGTTFKEELIKNRNISLDNIEYISINNQIIDLSTNLNILDNFIKENDLFICITKQTPIHKLNENYLINVLSGFFNHNFETTKTYLEYLKNCQILFLEADDISLFTALNLIKLGFTNFEFYLPTLSSISHTVFHNLNLKYTTNMAELFQEIDTFLQKQSIFPLNVNFKTENINISKLLPDKQYIIINTTFNEQLYTSIRKSLETSKLFINFYALTYATSFLYVEQIYNHIIQISESINVNNIVSLDRQDDINNIDNLFKSKYFKKPVLPFTYMLSTMYSQYIAEQILYNSVTKFKNQIRGINNENCI